MANMLSALDSVSSGQITYAVRSTQIDNFDLKEGDIIGLDQKTILTKGNDVSVVAISLVEKMFKPEHTMITLYYGNDVKEEEAQALKSKLAEKYSDCEIEVYYGGQPLYYYIISLE
jgi:hypothetical protein